MLSWHTKRLDKNQIRLPGYQSYLQVSASRLVGNGNAAIALAASDGSRADALNVLAAVGYIMERQSSFPEHTPMMKQKFVAVLTIDLVTLEVIALTVVGDLVRRLPVLRLVAAADRALFGRAGLAERPNASRWWAWWALGFTARSRSGGYEAAAEEHSKTEDGELHADLIDGID